MSGELPTRKKRDVLGEVINERKRQDDKWGEQNHAPHQWMIILQEEVGEAAKDLLEGTGDHRGEMIQVAAVAIAAVESLDRMKWTAGRRSPMLLTNLEHQLRVLLEKWETGYNRKDTIDDLVKMLVLINPGVFKEE